MIERDYTDRDFLEDYAGYYVKCLDKYHSRCARLHFFQVDFEQEDLLRVIRGEDKELADRIFKENGENYLGFVVVKPLPEKIIGRTCLRTYPKKKHRKYLAVHDYRVHVLGYTLNVTSLAFQEQDSTTSACATSSLWSTFQATQELFHHPIYSPVEITKLATRKTQGLSRSFPNHGLNDRRQILFPTDDN